MLGDKIESSLPPAGRRVFSALRLVSPLTLGTFAAHKFRQDPAFLSGYGIFSIAFTNVQLPLLVWAGVGPAAALLIRVVTGTPVDLSVLLLREHWRRGNGKRPIMHTVRELKGEYLQFTSARRREARDRVLGRRARAPGR